MAIFGIAGVVKEVNGSLVTVYDLTARKSVILKIINEEVLEVNSSGIFIGKEINNELLVHKISLRKFLDPLYEEDLIGISGSFNLLTPIEDPFPDLWNTLIAQQIEEEKKYEEKN